MISIGEASQAITALAAVGAMLISAAGVRVSSRNSRKIETVTAHIEKVETKVDKVATEANGMKTELVAEVRAASFAKGVKSEADKHS